MDSPDRRNPRASLPGQHPPPALLAEILMSVMIFAVSGAVPVCYSCRVMTPNAANAAPIRPVPSGAKTPVLPQPRIEIATDRFGAVVLARCWGRFGRSCRIRLDPDPDFGSALDALAALARRKRRRGYQDQHDT